MLYVDDKFTRVQMIDKSWQSHLKESERSIDWSLNSHLVSLLLKYAAHYILLI